MSNTRAFSSVIAGVLVFGLMVQVQENRGTPGVDYPNYDTIPKTSFSCSGQKYIPGLYADMETNCQAFHFCEEHGQESFLCPPGMTFNQASLGCDLWDKSNCSLTPQFYSMNTEPEIENARRKIRTFKQLRDKLLSRPYIRPSADVYEKITSLYDDTVGEEQSESKDLAAVDVKAESKDKISHEVGSEVPEEKWERREENEPQLNQDLSGIDQSILNEFAYMSEESEDSEPEIFYDPVTEKYYVDYDSSRPVNEVSEETFDQVGNFNYDGFGKRYGLAYNEYVNEIQRDSGSEYSKERANGLEFNDMLATIEASEKESSAMLDTEQRPLKRVRRRPLYRVVQEDNGLGISGVERGVKYPIDYVDNRFTTEATSTDAEVNFELSRITDGGEIKETESKVSYEVTEELQYPHIESVGNSEVQTSEFDQAILSELVYPEINERGLGRYLPSEEEQGEGSMQNDDSQAYETADQYSYSENVNPDDYESYSTDYTEVDREIAGEPEFVRENEENSYWYQDEESLSSEDSIKSEGTYMVIPDEYDNAFDQYSETNAQSDATNSFGAWRGFLPSYVSPAVYAPVGPYWSGPPLYYPDGYGRQPFIGEHLFDHDSLKSTKVADRPPHDQAYQYDFADISPKRYFSLADSAPYGYKSPVSFPGHVYDYSTRYAYPYANVYNPYIGNFAYDASEVKVATESSIVNDNSEAETAASSEYSESEMQYWDQSYSTESPEIEEEVEITSVLPNEEALANIYLASMANGELNEMPSETSDVPFDEKMKEAETFYLFDFDENSEEEFNADATDEVLDTNKLDITELLQEDEPSQQNESLDLEGINVGSEFESTGSQTESDLEDFDKENAKRLGRSESAENEKSIDSTFQTEDVSSDGNPVPLSASGIAAANTPRAQSPRQPRSYGSNIDLSRDPNFLINKIYSESNYRLQDAGLAQPYGTEDVSLLSNMEDGFFHRTGDAGLSRVSKLSELQKRILSLKQGKLGTLKKYMNPDGKNN